MKSMGRTGSASLPLHGGRVPEWLASRMARLGRVLTEAIVLHYGRDEFLQRLSHPFWFQSFGAVMGMDWHSSGITTSVIGALKRGLAPVQDELGIYVCGGRGRHSRRTPEELRALGYRLGLDGDGPAPRDRRATVSTNRRRQRVVMRLYERAQIGTDAVVSIEPGGARGRRRAVRRDVVALGEVLPAPVGSDGEGVPGRSQFPHEDRVAWPTQGRKVGVLHLALANEVAATAGEGHEHLDVIQARGGEFVQARDVGTADELILLPGDECQVRERRRTGQIGVARHRRQHHEVPLVPLRMAQHQAASLHCGDQLEQAARSSPQQGHAIQGLPAHRGRGRRLGVHPRGAYESAEADYGRDACHAREV